MCILGVLSRLFIMMGVVVRLCLCRMNGVLVFLFELGVLLSYMIFLGKIMFLRLCFCIR